MIAFSFMASLIFVLDLFSTIGSMAFVPRYLEVTTRYPQQSAVQKIREQLITVEKELTALEQQNVQLQAQVTPKSQSYYIPQSPVADIDEHFITQQVTMKKYQPHNSYEPVFTRINTVSSKPFKSSNSNSKNLSDLSKADLNKLTDLLSNEGGNKIDNNGVNHENPLDNASPDVEIVALTSTPVKYRPEYLEYNQETPMEATGVFFDKPVLDQELGGHEINYKIGNQPANTVQRRGFGDFVKDVLEDVENKLILDLQLAKKHGLTSEDIFKDLEAKRAGRKANSNGKDDVNPLKFILPESNKSLTVKVQEPKINIKNKQLKQQHFNEEIL